MAYKVIDKVPAERVWMLAVLWLSSLGATLMGPRFVVFTPPGFPLLDAGGRTLETASAQTVGFSKPALRSIITRMHKTLILAVLLLAALAAQAAQAEIVDIRWTGDGRFDHQATVAPAKFVELCGKLSNAQRVQWSFEAGAPLDFNIHYHVGKEVVYPAQLKAVATAQDSLTTTLEQDYCWMWTNKSKTTATLKIKLQRQ